MASALDIRVTDVRIGVANVHARLPFRFGNTTVHHVAHATLEVTVENRDGETAQGYAADFLSYAWFDKSPDKPPEQGSRELLDAIQRASDAWQAAGFGTAFALWRDLHPGLEAASLAQGQNKLSANFGVSMVERGVIDAIGRLSGQSFHQMIRGELLGIDERSVFSDLPAGAVRDALPAEPLRRIALRHTVGLVDPLTAADNTAPINDGLPETLEDYLTAQSLRYLKVKISSVVDETLDRLGAIAALCDRHAPIRMTLDGNEQFPDVASFAVLVDRLRATPGLADLWRSVLFIEQPVERTATLEQAIDAQASATIGKPMIIDESDGFTDAFRQSMELGYRGVSHKNCKGVFRSFLNNALAKQRNQTAGAGQYFLSAEDLSCLPVVSFNADLTAAASLGIAHAERNGHHYFRGLNHLSDAEQAGALLHDDLYVRRDGMTALSVNDGGLSSASLDCPGFGFLSMPDMDRLTPPKTWTFAS